MINFLQETEEVMSEIYKRWEDVKFIGSTDYYITVEQFKKVADVDYNRGYGAQHMPEDILIVFKDGTVMYRREYDGAEDWGYKLLFTYPSEQFPLFTPLPTNKMWKDLKDFVEDGNETNL